MYVLRDQNGEVLDAMDMSADKAKFVAGQLAGGFKLEELDYSEAVKLVSEAHAKRAETAYEAENQLAALIEDAEPQAARGKGKK